MLNIQSLSVFIEEQEILKNINLHISSGSLHVLMGPNGSGKSSFAYSLMNHPRYTIKNGIILFNQEDITACLTDQRAKKGIFLAAQYQYAIPGVQVFHFLREAAQALNISYEVADFYEHVCDTMDLLGIDQSFLYRNLNDGFSGGEKKRFELLQMVLFNPKLALLDEIDSGLDISGIEVFINAIELAREENPEISFLIVSHNPDVVKKLDPHYIHIMKEGNIVAQGNSDLIHVIIQKGYDAAIL